MARLSTQPIIAGVAIGAVTAIALVLLPNTAMESIIARTHLADVMTAAQPPLGTKARVLIALIPFFLFSITGFVLGFVLGRKKKDDYRDYGAYVDYGADEGADYADPFAVSTDEPIIAASYDPPSTDAPVMETAEPEPAPLPPPAPVAQPAATLDGATARDLAEIADAVVRLDARLDSIEARLGTEPKGAGAADLTKRLARIAKSLDEAG